MRESGIMLKSPLFIYAPHCGSQPRADRSGPNPYNRHDFRQRSEETLEEAMFARASAAAIAALCLVNVTALAQSPPIEPTILFENVRIFDGNSDTLSGSMNVLVRGNTINKISRDPIPTDRRADTRIIAGGGVAPRAPRQWFGAGRELLSGIDSSTTLSLGGLAFLEQKLYRNFKVFCGIKMPYSL